MKKQQIQATTKIEGGKLIAIASTENEDRVGDSLLMKDWDLSKFKANPVLQAGHDYRPEFTIGIAKNIKVDGKSLTFEPHFHEVTQLARDIKAMYEGGILKAWSVGFIPKEFKKGDNALNELLEVSAVAVPANAECLTMAKSYGETEAMKVKSWVEKSVDEKAEEKKVKAEGDDCEMEDGTPGRITDDGEGNMVCQAKKVEEKKDDEKSVKAVGDECELENGEMGSLEDDGEGNLVCMGKKKKEVEQAIEETKEPKIDLIEADKLVEKFLQGVEALNKCVSLIKDTTVALEKIASVEQSQEQKVKGNGIKGQTVKKVKGQGISAEAVALRILQKVASNANKGIYDLKNNGK